MRLLQNSDRRLDSLAAASHEFRQHRLQIGTGREGAAFGGIGIPDHETLVIRFGFCDCFLQAINHARAEHMQLRFQRHDQDPVILMPHADRFIFKDGRAGRRAIDGAFADQAGAENLALVHGQRRARHIRLLRWRP